MSRTLFEEALLDEYGICNNCFQRTHETEQDWFSPSRMGTQSEEMFQNPRSFSRPDTTEEAYVKTHERTSQKKYSCNCGSMDGRAFGNSESRKNVLMKDILPEVEDRLQEQDVPVDQEELYDVALTHKTNTKTNLQTDHEILREAIRASSEITVTQYIQKKQEELNER